MQHAFHLPNIIIPAKRSIPVHPHLAQSAPTTVQSFSASSPRIPNLVALAFSQSAFLVGFLDFFLLFYRAPVLEPFLFIPFCNLPPHPLCLLLFWLILLFFPLTRYRWSNVGIDRFFFFLFSFIPKRRNGSILIFLHCRGAVEAEVHSCTHMMDGIIHTSGEIPRCGLE
jgi:hypothetical protein